MREGVTPGESKPGVSYTLFVPADGGEAQRTSGESRSIMLTQFDKQIDLKKPFGVQFNGYFKAPQDGIYEFQVDSTWDAKLTIGDKMVIDEVGTSDRRMKYAIAPLKAGWHKVTLVYNHRGGDAHFRFRWALKGQGLRQIGGGELVH